MVTSLFSGTASRPILCASSFLESEWTRWSVASVGREVCVESAILPFHLQAQRVTLSTNRGLKNNGALPRGRLIRLGRRADLTGTAPKTSFLFCHFHLFLSNCQNSLFGSENMCYTATAIDVFRHYYIRLGWRITKGFSWSLILLLPPLPLGCVFLSSPAIICPTILPLHTFLSASLSRPIPTLQSPRNGHQCPTLSMICGPRPGLSPIKMAARELPS